MINNIPTIPHQVDTDQQESKIAIAQSRLHQRNNGLWGTEEAYPLAVGRARRQLALGDDVALVDAHEEAGLRLRRRHGRTFPARASSNNQR